MQVYYVYNIMIILYSIEYIMQIQVDCKNLNNLLMCSTQSNDARCSSKVK